MKKSLTFLLICCFAFSLSAQTVSDFENFNIGLDSALNGSDGSVGFTTSNIFLTNAYNPTFGSWSKWAISSMRDTVNGDYLNDLSSITGTGNNGSATYAVYFSNTPNTLDLIGNAVGGIVNGFYINNTTYGYKVMLNGNSFAKKFGGVLGTDPDYFLLTIKKYKDGILSTDSVDFYLADYRFSDNTQDYIIKDWTYVDLTSLGDVDSLLFQLTSTDVGGFGMNTPAYFAMDDFSTKDHAVNTVNIATHNLVLYPNPATEYITIEGLESDITSVMIVDLAGRVVEQFNGLDHQEVVRLPIGHLEAGMYFVKAGKQTLRLVKY